LEPGIWVVFVTGKRPWWIGMGIISRDFKGNEELDVESRMTLMRMTTEFGQQNFS
jgi:hypothetical protein